MVQAKQIIPCVCLKVVISLKVSFRKDTKELFAEKSQEYQAMVVTAIFSRASTEEEGTKNSWQEDKDSCKAVPGSVDSVLNAETIQDTSRVHFHTCKPIRSVL